MERQETIEALKRLRETIAKARWWAGWQEAGTLLDGTVATLEGAKTDLVADNATAVAFFHEHAGWSQKPGETSDEGHQRCARDLARAEAWAKAEGYEFLWERDDEDFTDDDGTIYPAYGCVMHCKHNGIAQSLWAIAFENGAEPCDPYKRVVEAELASEEMSAA